MVSRIQRHSRFFSRFREAYLIVAIAILCGFRTGGHLAEAYRVGDYVDAAVSTRSAVAIDLFLADRPQFGVSRTVHLPRLPERFSMSFEEGLHVLPYVEGQSIEQLIVTFVYSQSGGGRIHSVASKVVPLPHGRKGFDKDRDVEVVFDWVEQASVDLESGTAMMFLGAFVVSILFLLQLCSLDHGEKFEQSQRKGGYDREDYKGR
eukprot:jgi/Psemu1/25934/gm1.25934_g